MLDETTPKGRIVAAAMRLAAERPWAEVTFPEIAAAAGMSLAEMRREVSSKGDIVAAFTRAVDDQVLGGGAAPGPKEGNRDRLFEIVMKRFDLLAPYKKAVRSIMASPTVTSPALASALASQTWMLRASGIATDDILGPARIAGLASIYASVLRTWLEDGDPGMARTMAVLDRRLRRGERILGYAESAHGVVRDFMSFLKPRREQPAPMPPEAPSEPPPAPTAGPIASP